ncbi:MAG: DUF3429 domain-containing protein [Pseudomonadota bacterium]
MEKITSTVDSEKLKVSSAYALGLGGLIPFWTIPFIGQIAVWWDEETALAYGEWIVLYAAIIASFMSGGRWAFRVLQPDTRPASVFGGFLGAVGPALVAWVIAAAPAEVLGTPFGLQARFFCLAVILLVQLFQDGSQVGPGGVPPWYFRLRTMLAVGATTPILLPMLILWVMWIFTGGGGA